MKTVDTLSEQDMARRAAEWLVSNLPQTWTPVGQLTERQVIALVHAGGGNVEMRVEGDQLRFRIIDEFAISPRGDGGYIVVTKRRGT